MRALWAVVRKELTDHLRDRRSLTSALLMPLLGPLVVALLILKVGSWRDDKKPLVVPVLGAERAPSLTAFLERHGARVEPGAADHEEQIRDGKLEMALVIPEKYGEDFAGGRSAEVRLVFDASRQSASRSVQRAEALVRGYGQEIASLRLLARGVSPDLARPVRIEEVDLATPAKMAGLVLNSVPLFLLLAAFMGGMHLAIDSTAGERERGSLEPLLLNPVRLGTLIVGKWLTTCLASFASVATGIAAYALMLRRVPLEDLGIRATIGAREATLLLVVLLPLVAFTSAFQMLVASFARSFKEAQSYLQFFVILPSIPGIFLSLSPIDPSWWMMLIPTLGQQFLAADVIRGEAPSGVKLVLAGLGALALALGCLAMTTRLFRDERVIFGRSR